MAAALEAWHQAGTAAGDLAFWRDHAEQFRSPKAYALVVDALLEHRDPVAAMALLVQWLSQAGEIPLVEEDYSFHDLALDWMDELWERRRGPPRTEGRATADRRTAGRCRGSFSTTSKPTPRSTGRCRSSSWPAAEAGGEADERQKPPTTPTASSARPTRT